MIAGLGERQAEVGGKLADHFSGEAGRSIDAGTDRSAAERELADSCQYAAQPVDSVADLRGITAELLAEAVCQVVAQVIGNDAAVAWGGAAGNFELNVMLPVIARNLLESIRLIANVSRVFADRCVAGIEANVERCREYAESSPSIVTPLNHYVGYDEAAKIAKQALAERKTIRQVVIERGHVSSGAISEEKLDEVLDVLSMTRPASS